VDSPDGGDQSNHADPVSVTGHLATKLTVNLVSTVGPYGVILQRTLPTAITRFSPIPLEPLLCAGPS
jgi:hypothetical protein